MAHSRHSDADLLSKMADVFRSQGYEGTSLSDLSAVTGLEKASLYHRFPGGKQQIVIAVATSLNEWLGEHVIAVLHQSGEPEQRARTAAKNLSKFYGHGRKHCTLESLSLPPGTDALRRSLQETAIALLNGFSKIATDSNVSASTARRRAERAVIQIEGALILSRVLATPGPFLRVIKRVPLLLTAKTKQGSP